MKNEPLSNRAGVTMRQPILVLAAFSASLVLLDIGMTAGASGTVVAWGDNAYGQTNVPPGLTNATEVSGGAQHSLALKSDGTVVGWGGNTFGQANPPVGLSNVVAIAAGEYHSLALKSDGTVVGWGDNTYGQRNPPAGLSNVVAIAAGGYQSLAVQLDGTVVGWGDNTYGQRNPPAGLSNVVALAAGGYHSLALKSGGTVVGWGDNGSGQANAPAGLSNVVAVAAGGYHSLALKADGTVIGWGYNNVGQTNIPPGLCNVVAIAAGEYLSLAVQLECTVVGWGDNTYGQRNPPAGLSNVVAIAAGKSHSLAVIGMASPEITAQPANQWTYSGSPVVFRVQAASSLPITCQWRHNGTNLVGETNLALTLSNVQAGQAGSYSLVVSSSLGSIASRDAQLTVVDAEPIITSQPQDRTVWPMSYARFAVTTTGSLPQCFQWQFNGTDIIGATNAVLEVTNATMGRAGQYRAAVTNRFGFVTSSNAALTVLPLVQWGSQTWYTNLQPSLTSVVAIAAGPSHNLALKADGTVVGWGDNTYHQTNVPSGLSNVVAIAAGKYHSVALKSDGTMAAWGNNTYGQGNIPIGLCDVMAVKSGDYHTLALKSDGTVLGWGAGATNTGQSPNYGQSGVPPGLSNVVAISASGYRSLALTSDGAVVGWGDNTYGQGNAPSGLSNVVAIAAGYSHSLALKADGTVTAWGLNNYGQSVVPPGLSNVVAVAGGGAHTVVLIGDGTVLAWGWGDSGQTNVPSGLSNVVAIAANAANNLALLGDTSAAITVQPANQWVYSGSIATFCVMAVNSSESIYQWRLNGIDLLGETNAILKVSNVQNAGPAEYSVVVRNATGSAVSANAALNAIDSAPIITAQPRGQTNYIGSLLQFAVASTGSLPQTYRWQFNGVDIAGATNSTLALSFLTSSNAGQFQVVVSNAFGVATSSTAGLTVRETISWGDNSYGQIILPPTVTNIVAVAAGGYGSAAVKADGGFLVWGQTPAGQTGVPSEITNLGALALGSGHALARRNDGTVMAWGQNDAGQTNVPTGLADVAEVAAGDHHSLALRSNGVVVVWGGSPQGPSSLLDAAAIACGGSHNLALTSNGMAVAWGQNSFGQTTVPGALDDAVAVAGGGYHSLALRGDGVVLAWGNNLWGQINVPNGLTNVVAIAAGEYHSLALKSDGKAVAWGYNYYGQTVVPSALTNGCDIAPGYLHNLVLLGNGRPHWKGQHLTRRVLTGTALNLNALAVSCYPMSFQWQHNGTNLPGATNALLPLRNLTEAGAGDYSVSASNVAGSLSNEVATVIVCPLLAYANGHVLWATQTMFLASANIELRSAFANGTIFYTLDGSEPNFESHPYTGAFLASQSGRLRAIAYSADFMQTAEIGPFSLVIGPVFSLSATSVGGGSVLVDPPTGPYASNTVVQVTALAQSGWQFIGWSGDLTGTNSPTTITMNSNKTVRAVFATALNTTVAGNGLVLLQPPGGPYPYGTSVRLIAVPQTGSYFGLWGHAASGTNNPLNFTVTTATQTVSCLFASLSAEQYALTVVPNGSGSVIVSPRANRYSSGQSVIVTAVPDPQRSFLGWSGDATGSQNPLTVTMSQSRVITATFAWLARLSAAGDPASISRNGFSFALTGEPGGRYGVEASSDLAHWLPLVVLTNSLGTAQFTDQSSTNLPHRFYRAVTPP
jgi:alpha-tubulin suppressor-like RCC1 family protein